MGALLFLQAAVQCIGSGDAWSPTPTTLKDSSGARDSHTYDGSRDLMSLHSLSGVALPLHLRHLSGIVMSGVNIVFWYSV